MPDRVEVTIDGKLIAGFEDITISRSSDSISGSFSLVSTENVTSIKDNKALTTNAHIQIWIHGIPVIDGFIDAKTASISKGSHTVTLSGRDKTALLVDAYIDDNTAFTFTSWRNLISRLKIKELLNIDTQFLLGAVGDTSERKVTPAVGETYFDVLARIAKKDGYTLSTNGRGELVVSDGKFVSNDRRGARIGTINNETNLISASATYNSMQRYRSYAVISQESESAWSNGGRFNSVGFWEDYKGRDGKTYIEVDENASSFAELQRKAEWLFTKGESTSQSVTVDVQGFRASDINNVIYEPSLVVNIDLPTLNVVGEFEVISCTYKYSRSSGFTTGARLERSGAREINPTKVKDVISNSWNEEQ